MPRNSGWSIKGWTLEIRQT